LRNIPTKITGLGFHTRSNEKRNLPRKLFGYDLYIYSNYFLSSTDFSVDEKFNTKSPTGVFMFLFVTAGHFIRRHNLILIGYFSMDYSQCINNMLIGPDTLFGKLSPFSLCLRVVVPSSSTEFKHTEPYYHFPIVHSCFAA
jgi:hypothetical protein